MSVIQFGRHCVTKKECYIWRMEMIVRAYSFIMETTSVAITIHQRMYCHSKGKCAYHDDLLRDLK